MTLTLYEINLAYQLYGGIKTAHVSQLEKVLDARSMTKLTDAETSLLRGKMLPDRVFKDERDIALDLEQLKLLDKQMENPNIGLPVRRESIDFFKKIKTEIKQLKKEDKENE